MALSHKMTLSDKALLSSCLVVLTRATLC